MSRATLISPWRGLGLCGNLRQLAELGPCSNRPPRPNVYGAKKEETRRRRSTKQEKETQDGPRRGRGSMIIPSAQISAAQQGEPQELSARREIETRGFSDGRHNPFLLPRRKPCRATSAQRRCFSQTSATQLRGSCVAWISPANRAQNHDPSRISNQTDSTVPKPSSSSASTSLPYYALFPQTLPHGPPPHGPFKVDSRVLRREFLALQSKAHPDLFPPGDKARAEALSATINAAYRTLTSPLLRAEYILATMYNRDLEGEHEIVRTARDVGGNNTAMGSGSSAEDSKSEDPALLMEVLEMRELIEEAGSEDEIADLRIRNEKRERGSEEILSRAFAQGDVGEAAREVAKMRYWASIRNSLDEWEGGNTKPNQ